MNNLKAIIAGNVTKRGNVPLEVALGVDSTAYTSALEQLTHLLATRSVSRPKIDGNLVNMVANVLGKLWARIETGEAPVCPFPSSVSSNLTTPKGLLELLNGELAGDLVVPAPVTLAALNLPTIKPSLLRLVEEGRTALSSDQLEELRWAAYRACPSPELTPEGYLNNIVEGIEALHFSYPIDKLQDWAEKYAKDSVFRKPHITIDNYLLSLVDAWRTEWESGKVWEPQEYPNFLSLLSSRTRLRRLSRGMEHVCAAVFEGAAPFNQRVSHSKTNIPLLRKRWGGGGELGVTAETIFGLCVYTGLNPLSVLFWFADSEVRRPGRAKFHLKTGFRDMIQWEGSLDPHEYQRYIELIAQLGLVPDQHKFVLGLLSPGYVYANLPNPDELSSTIPPSYMPIVSDYCLPFLSSIEEFQSLKAPYKDFSRLVHSSKLTDPNYRVLLSGLFCLGLASRDLSGKTTEMVDGMGDEEVVALAESEMGLDGEYVYSSSPIPHRLVSTLYAGLDDYLSPSEGEEHFEDSDE